MIEYRCPKCGEPMASPESLAGKADRCPKCGEDSQVPKAGAPPVEAAPAPPMTLYEGEFLRFLENIRYELRWISFWSKLAAVLIVTGIGTAILFLVLSMLLR